MFKKLSAFGNSLKLIIGRRLFPLLDNAKDTPFEVRTPGEVLIVRPMRTAAQVDSVLGAADALMTAHEETFRKLAR
ncbi:AbrB/MazE/SpoVT family DNA-binding domain-containing protein [Aggregicoccus sp. 17bor-14]|uniref:AbrB/MazE/SpoVT family DNA-binding domain-containing protein n=1 Tax=Myxococcaceae TaxID=31 RepID=UPI00129C7FAC|nr:MULTISPECIES: AbrB/MazE/SpoVT family DNA-binding domain-containing protein [Myxococcaceae]MBF5044751.1 AbrB/MazE/SpoVT family DNA-binding domain-containing protein [Simulacricoccus sp. 17bor-14]MRI90495.1 AbrB/MazE/SpoVT family DNA-binding domain-containing protein [Aggregicoccus sp. 17bor-14]